MKFKSIKAIIIMGMLTLSSYSSAGLILDTDRDSFIDDTTGLEWIDFGIYNNTSLSAMNSILETELTGWRYATYSEAEVLFSNMFTDYLNSTTTYEQRVTASERGALDFFNDLIEITGINNPTKRVFPGGTTVGISVGSITDGINVTGALLYFAFTSCEDFASCTASGSISSGEFTDATNIDISWLIVKEVPEPSTLAILALSLIGLGARRFKK